MAFCSRLAFCNSHEILNDLTFTKKRSKLLLITLKNCLYLRCGLPGKNNLHEWATRISNRHMMIQFLL